MLRESTLREYARIFDAVVDFIDDNYGDEIMLWDFCEHSHYSRRSVQRALAYYKTTWRALLRGIRLQAAAKLLTRTDRDVSEICKEVGYHNQAQFTRTFGSYYGCSPRAYRQKHRVPRRKAA